jgi:hypothetical protein
MNRARSSNQQKTGKLANNFSDMCVGERTVDFIEREKVYPLHLSGSMFPSTHQNNPHTAAEGLHEP